MTEPLVHLISKLKIIFNVSKNESGNPGQNYKKIVKKYKGVYKVKHNLNILVRFE